MGSTSLASIIHRFVYRLITNCIARPMRKHQVKDEPPEPSDESCPGPNHVAEPMTETALAYLWHLLPYTTRFAVTSDLCYNLELPRWGVV